MIIAQDREIKEGGGEDLTKESKTVTAPLEMAPSGISGPVEMERPKEYPEPLVNQIWDKIVKGSPHATFKQRKFSTQQWEDQECRTVMLYLTVQAFPQDSPLHDG